jgi:hypothetical protein
VSKYLDIFRRMKAQQEQPPAVPFVPIRHSRRIYWRSMDGAINGPAVLDHLHLAPDSAGREWAWFCLSYRSRLFFVREDLLVPRPDGGKHE